MERYCDLLRPISELDAEADSHLIEDLSWPETVELLRRTIPPLLDAYDRVAAWVSAHSIEMAADFGILRAFTEATLSHAVAAVDADDWLRRVLTADPTLAEQADRISNELTVYAETNCGFSTG